MEFKNYFQYKVFENGDVFNSKNQKLKPQRNGFYVLSIMGKKRKIRCSHIVLFAFGIYPLRFKQQVKHIDGNIFNNSLNNLKW